MPNYTSFRLPSGATVFVQSSLPYDSGIEEVSRIDQKARETWQEGLHLVTEIAAGIVDELKAATASAKEVAVEFGINIGGKTSVILVEGTAAANLKVTVKW